MNEAGTSVAANNTAGLRDAVVVTSGLGRRFGRKWAVRDMNLAVPRGSVYGFLGLNGAGKSTTLRMLMGLLTPTAGNANVLGLNPKRDDVQLKRRVGYVPDTPSFYEWMTVSEILRFVAHYRKDEWNTKRAQQLMKVFDLPPDQKLESLSKGQRAKVSLITAMAYEPELLLLDEPTLGLDPLARREFLEGLLGEYMEGDRTVIISSHLINEIAGIVDHVGIIRQGTLVRSQPTEDLLSHLKRIRLIYPGDAPDTINIPGALSLRTDGREAVAVLDTFGADTEASLRQSTMAEQVIVEDLSLEDAFIALAGKDWTDEQ